MGSALAIGKMTPALQTDTFILHNIDYFGTSLLSPQSFMLE